MDAAQRSSVAQRAATVSVVSTAIVVAFKLVAAALSGSIAVLAEGMQSLLDVAMSLVALWGIRLAALPPDEDHPYGHGKAELLLSAFQMLLVIATAGVIAWQAALRLHDPQEIRVDWGLAAMGYAIVANSLLVWHLRRVSASTGSAALAGEAEHLRGDTLSSLGVLGGLTAYAFTGWKPLDPLIAILFTLAGAWFALRQLRRVLHPLMDGALPVGDIAKLEAVLDTHPQTRGYHDVRTRDSSPLRIVSLHVMLDDHLSFVEAHEVAEQIEAELSHALDGALVTVHYEPFEAETAHRAREHPGA